MAFPKKTIDSKSKTRTLFLSYPQKKKLFGVNMDIKNKIVETQEAKDMIVHKLSCDEAVVFLSDKSGDFTVVLDDNARSLLKTYYKTKETI